MKTIDKTKYDYISPIAKEIIASSDGTTTDDDGTLIKHNPDDGAVKLAIKALTTIHETL